MNKASAPAKPLNKSPSQPKPNAPITKGKSGEPPKTNVVQETPEPAKPNQYDATNSPLLDESPGEREKNVKTKLFQSPEVNINEVFDSSTKISEDRLNEDMDGSADKYTSAFARRLSTDFRNEVRRQSGTFERPPTVTEQESDVKKAKESKKLPPGAVFKKEIPRARRISRTVSVSFSKDEKKEESLKRGHSPTPEKVEGEFTIPASTTKKLQKRQRQKEKREAEKKEAEDKLNEEKKDAENKAEGEAVAEQPKEEDKKSKKKASPSVTKKTSVSRSSARHNKF